MLFGVALVLAAQGPLFDVSRFKPYQSGAAEGDFVIGPDYAPAPELREQADVPKGRLVHLVLDSAESKLYPGIAKTAPGEVVPYRRNVTVYVPSEYRPGSKAAYFVAQDSLGVRVIPTMLDNMIAARRLPVMIGIFIDSGGGDAQGSERGLEYDTMSGRYAEFVESEVLPRVAREAGVELTGDPNRRMTMGGSSGGACALSMAWYRPDLYHRVLSYSGTFVNQQSPFDPQTPRGAWEYPAGLIAHTPRKPLRLWLEVGEHDLRYQDPESTFHNWPLANVRTAAALHAKRVPCQFVFAREAGHVDSRVVEQTLPEAFEYVWKGVR